ncbi:hypothetical protein EYC84_001101 [Monilinia fructicola]|uniref:Uncharacterized protein n=1 Tax=Monilinia fructicola TaxID=38448 RepID=A0A5M9JLD6_MONFR|nr:hypothetical protein EYC84_001101 [Monilinia fructicola]
MYSSFALIHKIANRIMPLPTDPAVVKTSEDLVYQLQTLFGKHPGKRPAHAKGLLLTGTFTPTPPPAPSPKPRTSPRPPPPSGSASPTRPASPRSPISPPMPTPAVSPSASSSTPKNTDTPTSSRILRPSSPPGLGTSSCRVEIASEELKKSLGENYLTEEIIARLEKGPAEFKLLLQIAAEGDVTDDGTVHWPEDRKVVELGTIKVEGLLKDNEKEQKRIIFDPIPRVEGVDVSDDPLLDVRAGVYLISGKERRAA